MSLPRLPVPGRFGKLATLWPYALVFCLSFAIFFTFFYLRASIQHKIAMLENLAARHDIEIEGKEFSLFPPELKLRGLLAHINNQPLQFSHILVSAKIFPLALEINGGCLDGRFTAIGYPASLFNPGFARVEFNIDGISAKQLARFFADRLNYLEISGGLLNCSGQIAAEKSGNWRRPEGNADIFIANGSLASKIPVLKMKSVADIKGQARLKIDGQKLQVEECKLSGQNLSFEMHGVINGWQRPVAAALNLDTVLRIPAQELEKGLIPPRTLASIQKKGYVAAHIGQTLANPSLRVEK